MARYTIAGGLQGKQRLNVLAEEMRSPTASLLAAAGVRAGHRCVDVGCGGGHVSLELARLVGPSGSVVGIDLDEAILELARLDASEQGAVNVDFRVGDAMAIGPGPYDVAYARFLLSHVGDAGAVVSAMAGALAPGGVAIVEDTDFSGIFSYPESAVFQRYIQWYRETVRRGGGNPDIGPALPSLLQAAGLQGVQVTVVQFAGFEGTVKSLHSLTLERVAHAVVSEGVATEEEVAELGGELRDLVDDTTTLTSSPRIVQAWGVRVA